MRRWLRIIPEQDMGRLPRELEAKRQRLVRAAQRGAFDNYIRHGRVPETYARIAELAREAKALGDSVALPAPAASKLPSGRPTSHYTWRTAGDHKVRTAHAAASPTAAVGPSRTMATRRCRTRG